MEVIFFDTTKGLDEDGCNSTASEVDPDALAADIKPAASFCTVLCYGEVISHQSAMARQHRRTCHSNVTASGLGNVTLHAVGVNSVASSASRHTSIPKGMHR